MTPFTRTALIASVGLLFGAFALYRSVRPDGWKRRVLSWAGIFIGLVFLGAGTLLGVGLYLERHTMMGPDRPTTEELARPAEPFAYRLLGDDRSGHLADHQGDVILVNLWATWCVPCLREMPQIERLQAEYGDEGLTVVTLTNEDRETAMTAADRLPENTVNAYAPDQGALPQPFRRGFRRLPTSYVIDHDGYIREFWVGSRDYEALESNVVAYLEPR